MLTEIFATADHTNREAKATLFQGRSDLNFFNGKMHYTLGTWICD